ncbi:MAG: hypothetical protein HYS44_03150 [Candidatus Niyogibacteria bacterium]|nr:hypothetical protein [Candidatus Niyogibacteria bacterium]
MFGVDPFTAEPALGESALILLSECGSLKKGHFVLSRKNPDGTRNHSIEYVDIREVYAYPEKLWALSKLLAQCIHPSVPIDVVVGPARGGNDLSTGVAYWLNQLRFPKAKKDPEDSPIRRAWTNKIEVWVGDPTDEQKEEERFVVADCHAKFVKGKHTLIVDDVTTSGTTNQKVCTAVRNAGGSIVLVATIWNRGGVTSDALGGIPIFSLINRAIPSWPPFVCPPCKDGVPVNTDVGHGKEFLESKKQDLFEIGHVPPGFSGIDQF